MDLPRPHVNYEEYERIMQSGFARFPDRKENYRRFMEKWGDCKLTEYSDTMPIKMDYESASQCNFRCTMCQLSDPDLKRPANMTYDDFAKSIKGQYGLIEIKLQGIGEPLLNPELYKMIDLAVERDLWVRIATNGSLLHLDDNYKKLVDHKVGEIQISVDGATKDTFEKIRKGSDFDRVVENATLINKYAQSKGEGWRTSCWMLVQEENEHEVEKLLELAAKMNFTRLTYSIALSGWGSEKWEKINSPKERTGVFTDQLVKKLLERGDELGIEVTFWDVSEKFKWTPKRDQICAWPFSRAFISSDTRIVPCCGVANSQTCDLGNAREFQEEWNNDAFRKMRKMHIDGTLPRMCRNCYE